jgi:nucleoside recognition membrane protein YjiH
MERICRFIGFVLAIIGSFNVGFHIALNESTQPVMGSILIVASVIMYMVGEVEQD